VLSFLVSDRFWNDLRELLPLGEQGR